LIRAIHPRTTLQAGEYRIQAEQSGFRKGESEAFTLNSGTRPRIDLQLSLGAVSESVQVVAAAPLINATTTDLGIVIDNRKIESLPLNGRNFQQLVGLQTGTLSAPPTAIGQRGGIEFNGSDAYGNNLLLDGIDMSWRGYAPPAARVASPKSTPSASRAGRIQGHRQRLSAEYGRSTGGALNLTTKSGTNDFTAHCSSSSNDALMPNSFSPIFRTEEATPALEPVRRQLGGPIRRDRIFFSSTTKAPAWARARRSPAASRPPSSPPR
jgi:hypothetical protein